MYNTPIANVNLGYIQDDDTASEVTTEGGIEMRLLLLLLLLLLCLMLQLHAVL